LAILSPNDGDLFKIDPSLRREYQTIRIRASIPTGMEDVRLLVDDAESRSASVSGTWWNLTRGKHELRVEGKSGEKRERSKGVRIVVE
jgi:hypothetical protein